MIDRIGEKIKGFLLKPVETFRNVRDEEISLTIGYFIVLLVFYGLLSGIISALGVMRNPIPSMLNLGLGQAGPIITFFTVFFTVIIVWLFLLLIWGLWLHLWVYVVGGRKEVWQTEKAVLYGTTPFLLIGWIPVIGLVLGGLWSIILQILGIRELHEISTTKAILALVIPFVIIFIIFVLILAWLVIAVVSSGMVPTQYSQY
jgi:hypothetical protein